MDSEKHGGINFWQGQYPTLRHRGQYIMRNNIQDAGWSQNNEGYYAG
jgi:hypothetical protein